MDKLRKVLAGRDEPSEEERGNIISQVRKLTTFI